MFDIAAMSGMITSLKAIADLSQLAINARDAGVVRAKVIELQGQIVAAQAFALAAQAEHSSLLNRERELEKEVTDLKAWAAEKEKYHLAKPSPRANVYAYALKTEEDPTEPFHHICPNCYQNGIKSILQAETRMPLADVLVCARCGLDIYLTGHPRPEHSTASRKPPRR